MRVGGFEDIEAWPLARDLACRIHRVTAVGGFRRDPGLKSQIRNAAGSAMHNIAEGFDSATNREFVRFLVHARRSCTEVQRQMYLASDAGYLDDARSMAGPVEPAQRSRDSSVIRNAANRAKWGSGGPPTRNPERGTRNAEGSRDGH